MRLSFFLLKCFVAFGLALSLPSSGIARAKSSKSAATVPADANLFIYRAFAQPTAWMPTVKVDGKKVVALPNRHYAATTISTGPHKVTLSWPFLSGQSSAEIDFIVEMGKHHYLEVTGVSQMSGVAYETYYFRMGSGIAEVRPEHAETTIASCCAFKPNS